MKEHATDTRQKPFRSKNNAESKETPSSLVSITIFIVHGKPPLLCNVIYCCYDVFKISLRKLNVPKSLIETPVGIRLLGL